MKTKYTINSISGEGDFGTNSTHTISSVNGMKRILTKLLCGGDRWAFFSSETIPYFSSPVERYYIHNVDDMFALLTKQAK